MYRPPSSKLDKYKIDQNNQINESDIDRCESMRDSPTRRRHATDVDNELVSNVSSSKLGHYKRGKRLSMASKRNSIAVDGQSIASQQGSRQITSKVDPIQHDFKLVDKKGVGVKH